MRLVLTIVSDLLMILGSYSSENKEMRVGNEQILKL